MLRSFLIGLVAGARSMTPLAAVSAAARRGALPPDNGAAALLANPWVSRGAVALAAGELLGDKLPAAPNRTSLPGLAGRIVSGALAGAALAPRNRRVAAALRGAAGAVAGGYLSFGARKEAMRRFGQTSTGLVEDAIVMRATRRIVNGATAKSP